MAYKPNSKWLRGWNRLDPDSMGTITWTESTRTFSIAPVTGRDGFYFWSGGKLFRKTTAQSVVIPDTSGTYYVYFGTDGLIGYIEHANITEAIFKTVCITSLCYYNATESKLWYAKDEQHGILMDPATHYRMHFAEGTAYMSGLGVSGLADASDTYTSIASGVTADEDITISTSSATTHPFMYRDGSNGDWKETAADNKCGYIDSGDTYCSWNEDTGSGWQLTESTNTTDYIIMFFVWTNFADNPIKKIIGQKTYASRADARNGLKNELTAIALEGLPSTEFLFLYAYICKRDGTLEDDGNGNAYVDLRGTKGYNLPD